MTRQLIRKNYSAGFIAVGTKTPVHSKQLILHDNYHFLGKRGFVYSEQEI